MPTVRCSSSRSSPSNEIPGVARKLEMLGCYEIPRQGSGPHRRWLNPQTQRDTVLPDWGGRDLKIGTLRSAMGQLALDWQVFLDS